MRSETAILSLILSTAEKEERIRAVILNGSRVNHKVKKDDFQDFDVIYLVEELDYFRANPNWIDIFGERIIMQMPNEMNLYSNQPKPVQEDIAYLMLFKDFNRIDLTLVALKNKDQLQDSLTKILLDKDNLFKEQPVPNDSDYWTRKPSQKDYADCCNEFWWVATYVVKGLARNDLLYAKDMLENPVRKMFMRMIAWHVAADHGFMINLGKSHRFLKNYIAPKMRTQILNTYPNAKKQHIWNSLLTMTRIFEEKSQELAHQLELKYNAEESNNVKAYLKLMEKEIVQ